MYVCNKYEQIRVRVCNNMYVICNAISKEEYKSKWMSTHNEKILISKRVSAYSSDTNEDFLSKDDLKKLIKEFKKENNYF